MRFINTLIPAKLFSHRPAPALTPHLQDSSLPLLLDAPFPVDCCCYCNALLMSTKRTAAFPWQSQDHCSRTCLPMHHQCHCNILLPSSSSSQHFRCPSHFIAQDVLSKCTPKNVLSKCTGNTVSQASSLLTLSHSGHICHCGTVVGLWRSPPVLANLRLPSGATHPATAGRPLWAGFARGAVSHSRPA